MPVRFGRGWFALGVLCTLCAVLVSLGCEEIIDRATARRVTSRSDGARSATGTFRGAGATFPAPIYTRWALQHYEHSGDRLSYQPLGSARGVEMIKAGTIDFGATDVPLAPDELAQHGLFQFPAIIGGVVPVVHLQGVGFGDLRLTAELLADIYAGEITRWDDPALRAINPGLALPAEEIIPVHRSDSSGSTRLFTRFLSSGSETWRGPGASSAELTWPAGVMAESSEQMTRFVARFEYTIGYLEFEHARTRGLVWVSLLNRAGRFVTPSRDAFAAAAANADWSVAPELPVSLIDLPGPESWPITGVSYVLVERAPRRPGSSAQARRFFEWALSEGQRSAERLNYVTVPAEVVQRIKARWDSPARPSEDAGAR